jgi:predicted secreted protein
MAGYDESLARLGNEATVLLGIASIAEWTKASLKAGRDTIDVTNHDSGLWKEFLKGHKNWSVTLEANSIPGDTAGQVALIASYLNDTILEDLAITDHDGGVAITGDMFVTDLTLDFPLKDKQAFTVTLQGTGALGIA